MPAAAGLSAAHATSGAKTTPASNITRIAFNIILSSHDSV